MLIFKNILMLIAIFNISVCCLSVAADENYFFHKKTQNMTFAELDDCARKDDICKIQLGQAYLYGEKTKDKKILINVEKSEKLLESVLRYPYARYLSARILLWVKDNDKNSNEYLKGISLMQSSCLEGVLKACVMSANIYMGNYEKFNQIKDINNPIGYRRAEFMIKKGLDVINDNIKNLNGKEDKISGYEREVALDEKSSYEEFLGRIMIKKGDKKGIDILENILIDKCDFNGDILAEIYEKGNLVDKNVVKAYMYYDLGGSASVENKKNLTKQMTSAQIREAQELSWKWQEKHHSYRVGYRNATDFPIQSHIIYK